MRVDLTINIPTILSILGLVSAVGATGLSIYNDLDKRQMRTDIAVAEIRTRLDKTETTITSVKADQAAATATLRGEMKGDIIEIKDMLNRLIFGGREAPPERRRQLDKDWSK